MKTCILKIISWIGWLGCLLCLTIIGVVSYSSNETMNEQVNHYNDAKSKAYPKTGNHSKQEADQALNRASKFLQNIGSEEYIENEIVNVYAEDAYFNDTLKSLTDRNQIKEHFVKTSKTMTDYSLVIDDIASTEKGYYLRWTMKFSAPKLAKGEEIVSVGMSHIIFDSEGKILLHQDFWDSSTGLFEHVPLLGGGIRLVKKRL